MTTDNDDPFAVDPNSSDSSAGAGGEPGDGNRPTGDDDVLDTTRGTSTTIVESVDELVGEGKKFSNPDLLAKGYADSQTFIEQLKRENAQMRDELRNSEKLDTLLSRIKASNEDRGNGEGDSRGTPGGDTGQNEATSMSQDEITKLVESEVTRRESERTAQQNEERARELLLKRAGNDTSAARKMLTDAAQELGVSVEYLRNQAKTSPSVFERIVVGAQPDDTSPSTDRGTTSVTRGSSHNTGAVDARGVDNRGDGAKPYSYFRKLRETVSKGEFYSPRVQNEMMRSRLVLGEDAFYNN